MGNSVLKGKKVLIIDDDVQVCSLLQVMIMTEGADARAVLDSTKAMREMYTFQPDLVLLDIMMPRMDGYELCHQIRQLSDVPIIMLTALHQPNNVVRGLEAGADDYVTKPFQREVLIARAAAVLRRAEWTSVDGRPPVYHDNRLSIDLDGHQVLVEGKPIQLSAKEFGLLTYLVQHTGRVRTFSQILERVWGEGYDDSAEYVHVYVSRLRKKLEADPSDPLYLVSEHGIGYRFAPANASHF